jgi:hypothetical protein
LRLLRGEPPPVSTNPRAPLPHTIPRGSHPPYHLHATNLFSLTLSSSSRSTASSHAWPAWVQPGRAPSSPPLTTAVPRPAATSPPAVRPPTAAPPFPALPKASVSFRHRIRHHQPPPCQPGIVFFVSRELRLRHRPGPTALLHHPGGRRRRRPPFRPPPPPPPVQQPPQTSLHVRWPWRIPNPETLIPNPETLRPPPPPPLAPAGSRPAHNPPELEKKHEFRCYFLPRFSLCSYL